jgi:hypothetical protein
MFLCYNSRQRAKKVFTLDGDPVKTWRLAFSVYGLAPALRIFSSFEIWRVAENPRSPPAFASVPPLTEKPSRRPFVLELMLPMCVLPL